MPPIWVPKSVGTTTGNTASTTTPKTSIPVISLLLDGPFTDYHVSSLMLAAYMGHVEVSGSVQDRGNEHHIHTYIYIYRSPPSNLLLFTITHSWSSSF